MFKKSILGVAVLAFLPAFAGCVSGPTPDKMARNTMQTAPADLQLACANAATAKFGADHANALPVSSSAVDGGNFQIIVEAKGQRSTCLIDTAGTVLSLEKISA